MLLMLATLVLLATLIVMWLASDNTRQPAVRPVPVYVESRRRRR